MDRIVPIILLKLRLTFRQGRGAWNTVGIALMVLFFVIPLSLALAAFAFAGLNGLDRAGDIQLLHLVLAGLWVFWLVFPVVGFSLNQSYDLTKLFVYPLSKRRIFVANLLSCFADPTLIIALPVFAVILFFYGASPAGVVITSGVLVLFLAHTIALSQAALWGLLNILRSRRIRDWAILLAPLIFLTIYMAPQLLARGAAGPDVLKALLEWQPSRYFGYLPPGLAVRAIMAADRGAWPNAGGYGAALAGCLLAAIWFGGWVLGRLQAGELGAYPVQEERGAEGGPSSVFQRLATNPLAALALKEARYYWREPRHKSMFIAPLFPLIVLFGGVLAERPIPATLGVGIAASMCLLGFSSLFQNIFGIDREGLRLLFLTPCNREDILIGKNAASVAVATTATAVAVLAAGFILHDPLFALMCLPFLFPIALVLAAVGNVVSIHFPIRMARRGENPFTSSSGHGCLTGIINLAAFQVGLLIAAPIAVAAVLPAVLGKPAAYAIAIPVAVVYGVGVYAGLLRFYSAAALQQNETKIIEECLTGEPG